MRKLRTVIILFSFFISHGCLLPKPVKIEVDYYDDGHVKQVRKYYKDGRKVEYYAMEKKRKKPYGVFHGLFFRKIYPKK